MVKIHNWSPIFNMKFKRYTLEHRPSFKQNDKVLVDFSCMFPNGVIACGTIVGKSTQGIIDIWIVQFNKCHWDKDTYPFTTVAVMHTFILDNPLLT